MPNPEAQASSEKDPLWYRVASKVAATGFYVGVVSMISGVVVNTANSFYDPGMSEAEYQAQSELQDSALEWGIGGGFAVMVGGVALSGLIIGVGKLYEYAVGKSDELLSTQ